MSKNYIKIEELPTETLLTRKQVSEILKIGISTLDKIIKEDCIPLVHVGRHVYIAKIDLENYVNNHRIIYELG